ncbi:MAG: methyltransferase domain-containing protein [Steroidobacteraceae bacterium]
MYQWNAADYAKHSQGQERWARELLAGVSLSPNEQVLDVGCGDGRITAGIAMQVPQGRVLGTDLSVNMVAHAQQEFAQLPNLSFQQADAAALPYRDEFTLVFSNAALHWVRDHRPVLAGISRALRQSGRFVAQMGGAGNGAGMVAAFEQVISQLEWQRYFDGFVSSYGFHHSDDYVVWMREAGLQAEQCQLLVKDMVHANLVAFAGWIRTAWHPYTSRVPEDKREQFIADVVSRYVQSHPVDATGQVHVQMVRLQVRAVKVA